jgi:hypothetical protein
MPHEPSRSRPSVQQTAGRRCPSCRTVKPLDDFPGTPAGCCTPCRRRNRAVARRRRQRTLRQVTRRAEAGYHALLTELQRGGGGDAA